jgi:hypothetical protein
MGIKSQVYLSQDRIREAMLTNHNYRLECMRFFAQLFLFGVREIFFHIKSLSSDALDN